LPFSEGRLGLFSRQDAKNAKFGFIFSFAAFAPVREIFRVFGCSSAAPGFLQFIRWLKFSPVMVFSGKGELLATIVLMSFGSFVIYEARGLPYHSSVGGLM
jgi:hypothetical protein